MNSAINNEKQSVLLGWISKPLSPYFDGQWVLFQALRFVGRFQSNVYPKNDRRYCSCNSQLEGKRFEDCHILFPFSRLSLTNCLLIQYFLSVLLFTQHSLFIYTIFLFHKSIIDTAFLLDENTFLLDEDMKKEKQQEIYRETN